MQLPEHLPELSIKDLVALYLKYNLDKTTQLNSKIYSSDCSNWMSRSA